MGFKVNLISTKDELITSKFGNRKDPFGTPTNEFHNGIDIVSSSGKQKISDVNILAYDDGVVSYVTEYPSATAGCYVEIQHPKTNLFTRYLHMKKDSIKVKQGQKVKKGDPLGIMGTTGKSTGIHLHFTIEENTKSHNVNKCVDPEKYLLDEVKEKVKVEPVFPITPSAPIIPNKTIEEPIHIKTAPNNTTNNNDIKIGNKVKVKQGAKTYNNGSLAKHVYNTEYDVYQINKDRVVISIKDMRTKKDIVVAAINILDLIKI